MIWFILSVMIYRESDALDSFETGTVTAQSCAAAEQYVRAGLLPGQRLLVGACVQQQSKVAGR